MTISRASQRLWLSNTKCSPISVLLDQLLYRRGVSSKTANLGKIAWSKDYLTVSYEDKSFVLEEFKVFFAKLLEVAETTLVRDLLLAANEPNEYLANLLSPTKLGELRDNPGQTKNSHSMFDILGNNLGSLIDLVKRRLDVSQNFARENETLRPTAKHHRQYSEAIDKFLERRAVVRRASIPRVSKRAREEEAEDRSQRVETIQASPEPIDSGSQTNPANENSAMDTSVFEAEWRQRWLVEETQRDQRHAEGTEVRDLESSLVTWHFQCPLCAVRGTQSEPHS